MNDPYVECLKTNSNSSLNQKNRGGFYDAIVLKLPFHNYKLIYLLFHISQSIDSKSYNNYLTYHASQPTK